MSTFDYRIVYKYAIEHGELEKLMKGEGKYFYDDRMTNLNTVKLVGTI